MPIDSHADLFGLAKQESDIGIFYKKIAIAEKKLNDARNKLAEEYDVLVKIKSEAKRFMEELAKKIEDLGMIKGDITGVDKSKIDKSDIDMYKKEAASFEEDVNYYAAISEAIKTASFQALNVVEKLNGISLGFEKMGEAMRQFVKADQTLFEKKDKLSDKKGTMEDAKAAAGRSFDQAKADIARRKDEHVKELDKFYKNLNEIVEKMKV